MNTTASEGEAALQMSAFDDKKKALKWKTYVSWHVKYNIILENLRKYGYQDLDLVSKVCYLLSSIKCDKLFTAIATVKAHPDRYKKYFDAVITFLMQYIKSKYQQLV